MGVTLRPRSYELKGSANGVDVEAVQALVDQRAVLRQYRYVQGNNHAIDAIRDTLRDEHGVHIDDRGQFWSVGRRKVQKSASASAVVVEQEAYEVEYWDGTQYRTGALPHELAQRTEDEKWAEDEAWREWRRKKRRKGKQNHYVQVALGLKPGLGKNPLASVKRKRKN